MNVITRPRMTLDEFLAWEREQELAYEFDGESVIEMNGESLSHNLIVDNVHRVLWPQIDRRRHLVVTAGVKVVRAGRVRYPDVIVANAVANTAVDRLPEPVVVFEVLSPSSVRQDRMVKTAEYGEAPSIEHYVILAQDTVWAQVWTRVGGVWTDEVHGQGAVLRFDCIGAVVTLEDCYEGVTLPPQT